MAIWKYTVADGLVYQTDDILLLVQYIDANGFLQDCFTNISIDAYNSFLATMAKLGISGIQQ